jgi:hypothetical protein
LQSILQFPDLFRGTFYFLQRLLQINVHPVALLQRAFELGLL